KRGNNPRTNRPAAKRRPPRCPRRTENREAVDPNVAQGKGRRSAPLGAKGRKRVPHYNAPPRGKARIWYDGTNRRPRVIILLRDGYGASNNGCRPQADTRCIQHFEHLRMVHAAYTV